MHHLATLSWQTMASKHAKPIFEIRLKWPRPSRPTPYVCMDGPQNTYFEPVHLTFLTKMLVKNPLTILGRSWFR